MATTVAISFLSRLRHDRPTISTPRFTGGVGAVTPLQCSRNKPPPPPPSPSPTAAAESNRRSIVAAEKGEKRRSLDSAPYELAVAVEAKRVPEAALARFVELQKSPLMRLLMRFGGFSERILADDLFFAKLVMECGVGIITKTTAEFERRRENFGNELDFVLADVVMALIADFLLVWLPAPTISLSSPLSFNKNPIARYFDGCPDNAFQVELTGTSYTLKQRISAIMLNGLKLFFIGTASSLIGTGVTQALIIIRKVLDKDYAGVAGDIPILQTSIGYGAYMAFSSNLRYQLLAGVIEQRILEPILYKNKLLLGLSCFAFRTGNTFLGSLLWVDYARLIGIQ